MQSEAAYIGEITGTAYQVKRLPTCVKIPNHIPPF